MRLNSSDETRTQAMSVHVPPQSADEAKSHAQYRTGSHHGRLSFKLLWYITPLVIVPLLVLGGYVLSKVTELNEENAELLVGSFVAQQQHRVYNYTNGFHATTSLLANSPVLNHYLSEVTSEEGIAPTTRQASLNELLDVFVSYTEAYSDIISIELISKDRSSLAFYAANLFAKPNTELLFNRLSPNVARQLIVNTEPGGETRLFFATPVLLDGQSSEFTGYLVMQVSPSMWQASMLESPFNASLNFIINTQGQILFSSNSSLQGKFLTEYELKSLIDIAHTKRLTPLNLASISQTPRMVFVGQMNRDSFFISAIPTQAINELRNIISSVTASVVVVAMILLPILIFIVVRTLLLNPIAELASASHKVGDGDLDVQLPTHRNDEMGALFDDFNHMVSQIRHYQGQLEDYKIHLEEKVATRTEALAKMNSRLELAITQAEQANKLKSRFLANMSHEIRTPLTAILGFTEQLLKTPGAHQEQHLGTILRNSNYLLEIINNILDLSKIEAEKLNVDTRDIALDEVIVDVLSIVSIMAAQKQLELVTDIAFPLPKVIRSDNVRLKQILLNVLSNAVKFTEQGKVYFAVRYAAKAQSIEFIVRDEGIGISPMELERIFKPFEQADASTTRRFGGTGLGLCIAKNLANLLGGDITADSKKGEGSVFVISVATHITDSLNDDDLFYHLDHNKTPTEDSAELTSTIHNAHILVAEDNPDNQALIKLILEQYGVLPDFANNGAEAVEMAMRHDYDLVLMDMQMPVMGGLEATKMLRHAAYDGPIIALTANVMKEDIQVYERNGINYTLAKPIDTQKLARVLAEHIHIDKENKDDFNEILESDRFKQIQANFCEKLRDSLHDIQYYHQIQEWNELQAKAHALKGSAACFQFMTISNAAAKLEEALLENKHHQLDYIMMELEHAVEVTLKNQLTTEPHE